jgi:hypothetical protein
MQRSSREEGAAVFPSGAIARVQALDKHKRFIEAAEPAWISLKMHHLKTLVKDGETADSWTPDNTSVITTSTIPDERLDGFPVHHEVQLIEAFDPAVHIGGDLSVYDGVSRLERAETIQEYMKNAIYVKNEVSTNTKIVPLIKGFTPSEQELCFRGLKYFDHDYVAYYTSQLFTSGNINRMDDLMVDLERVNGCTDAKVISIGMLAESLREMPSAVVASAGFSRWHNRVDAESDSERKMRRVWEEIEADVYDYLFGEGGCSE